MRAEDLNRSRQRLQSAVLPHSASGVDYGYLVHRRRDDRQVQEYEQLFQNALLNPGPYPSDRTYDFGYWFNYYWLEAINQPNTEALWAPYSVVFDYEAMTARVPGLGKQSYYHKFPRTAQMIRPEFLTLIERNPQTARRVLMALFERGFEEPPAALVKPSTQLFYSQLWMPGYAVDFDTMRPVKERDVDQQLPVRLAYRGDGRKLETVLQHLGTRAKNDIESASGYFGLDKAWHPYSDSSIRKKMWMRKASGDHDYESMTSVSQNFGVACAYPMIKLNYGFEGNPADWTPEKRKAAKTKFGICFARVKTAAGPSLLALASTTSVFVINVTGQNAVDTFHYHDMGYNERGIRGVGLRDLLAVFKCRRVHHPVRGRGTVYMSTQEPSTVFLTDWNVLPGVMHVNWNGDGYGKFINNLQSFFNTYRTGWDNTHSGAAGTALMGRVTIKKPTYTIEQWDV